jgi:hypothetical protein
MEGIFGAATRVLREKSGLCTTNILSSSLLACPICRDQAECHACLKAHTTQPAEESRRDSPRPPPNGHVSGRTWGLPLSGRQRRGQSAHLKAPDATQLPGAYILRRGTCADRHLNQCHLPPDTTSAYWPIRISSVCMICTERSFGLSSPQTGHVGLQNRVGHSYMARGRQLYTLLARPMP